MSSSATLKIEMFAREHMLLHKRLMYYIADYKSQFRYFSLYLTIFAGVTVYLLELDKSKLPQTVWLYDVVLGISICLAYSISASLFDSLFEIYMIEARISAVEVHINNEMRSVMNDETQPDIYAWQSKIINPLHEFDSIWATTEFLVNPPHLWGFWNFLFFIGLTVLHCVLYIHLSSHHYLYFCLPVIIISLGTLWQWLKLTGSVHVIRKRVFAESGLEYIPTLRKIK